MPQILWFYVGGLMLATAVGFAFYFAIGAAATPLWESLFGGRAGAVWGRAFRLMLVAAAVLGGLSVKWYGCRYNDYAHVQDDPQRMTQLMTEQVSEAMFSSTALLVAAAVIGSLMFAVLHHWRRPAERPDR